jgi:hypothetical protein
LASHTTSGPEDIAEGHDEETERRKVRDHAPSALVLGRQAGRFGYGFGNVHGGIRGRLTARAANYADDPGTCNFHLPPRFL